MKRQREQIVLGLRATPEQRAWLNALAKERGISLQALFEQVMRQQFESSPWRQPDEVLVSIPVDAQATVASLSNVYRSGLKRLIELVDIGVKGAERVLHSEEAEIIRAAEEGK
jgi:hypothetical protein